MVYKKVINKQSNSRSNSRKTSEELDQISPLEINSETKNKDLTSEELIKINYQNEESKKKLTSKQRRKQKQKAKKANDQMIKSLESKNIEKTQENQKIDKKDKTYKNKGTEFLFKPTMDKNFTDNEYYKNTKSKNLMQSKMKEYQNMENYDHMYKNYQPYSQMEPKIKYWDKYNTDRNQYDLQSYRNYDKYMA